MAFINHYMSAMLTWNLLSIIGTVAFSLSGAIVAIEEEYDVFGAYILGLATAFGGGIIRNLLIGYPISAFWQQEGLFQIALFVITLILIFPHRLIRHWKRWENLTDAIGLAAFAIQGALYAQNMKLPISAIIVAALLTGTGGGMIRDILANRKPLVLHAEIYALWAILAGIMIGSNYIKGSAIGLLFFAIFTLRMLSIYFKWNLPQLSLAKTHLPKKST